MSNSSRLLRLANSSNWSGLLEASRDLALDADAETLFQVAGILLDFGFTEKALRYARQGFEQGGAKARLMAMQARAASEQGDHERAQVLYQALLALHPDQPSSRSSALMNMAYSPLVDDAQRFEAAKMWGQWADRQARARLGSEPKRPAFRDQTGPPLRVGFVSADFCQHTVGLFLKDVLKALDGRRLTVLAYSNGSVSDWVTKAVQACCQWRDVRALDDLALAEQIKQDQVDVLVDLSGHTGGSRLAAFAYRPAPVHVSWLGYFATTGLASMDAVLLDEWHLPVHQADTGPAEYFTETVVRIPGGRFCYQPVPWAPKQVSPPPCKRNGFVTFGSFNNTAKLNDAVLDVWAEVLHAVPASRLVLKWRTLNDPDFRRRLTGAFALRGVDSQRLELRGPSFHNEVLVQYGDIDIALDPFPFTGGLTTCEALWMGVPVVTWPQARMVSRQSHALLSQIGLTEFSASNAAEYVRIARDLAIDPVRLAGLRSALRPTMAASGLMDVAGFARSLEETLLNVYVSMKSFANAAASEKI